MGKFFMGFRRAKSTQGNTNCQLFWIWMVMRDISLKRFCQSENSDGDNSFLSNGLVTMSQRGSQRSMFWTSLADRLLRYVDFLKLKEGGNNVTVSHVSVNFTYCTC